MKMTTTMMRRYGLSILQGAAPCALALALTDGCLGASRTPAPKR